MSEGDVHNKRREINLAAWHLVLTQMSEPITKGGNYDIEMSGHKPSNS
jgi:hypothetical protein